MALSKNFFGIRHGSTKSATFSEFRGTQITKERVVGGKGNAAQAARFSDMAKAFQLFKGMISREDFFREAQKVEVVRYTDDGFPLAPWPCSWGNGQSLSLAKLVTNQFLVDGLFTGFISESDVPYYLMGSLADANRFRLLPLFEANFCQDEMRLCMDFWYRSASSSLIRHASTSCRLAFVSSDMNAALVEDSGVVDANEQSLSLASPFSSSDSFSFLAWEANAPKLVDFWISAPTGVDVLLLAVRSVIDGRLSKSFCYVP